MVDRRRNSALPVRDARDHHGGCVALLPASPSSIVTITVELNPVNHGDARIAARFVFSHASPCCTVPSCMSSVRFGLIDTKSGALAPSSVVTAAEVPGYGRDFQTDWLSLNISNGLCLRA